ncbi:MULTISPECIES: general secretion pathway protein GspL [unclassified Variovorax]|jgi:sorbitol-specific phosphotransferase system component IIC|uniref:general secretion pathway protein GspL n=1 Tax=unclassified Variovorax TaxID=663243 RepID=UPI00210F01C7|nr:MULTISPECIES: general secretion pathway protein GspL [unclassified Variovorax]
MRHSIEALKTDDASSTVPRIRRGNWRAMLVGALVGLLIVMVLLMKWLMEHQVEAAAQRRAQEAVARAAVAQCFELASPRAVNACRKAQEADERAEAR